MAIAYARDAAGVCWWSASFQLPPSSTYVELQSASYSESGAPRSAATS